MIRLTPATLSGAVTCPASKSFAHRALIAAALSGSPCFLHGRTEGNDVEATASCLRALGAGIEKTKTGVRVTPALSLPSAAEMHVGASGSTLRFMLPIVAALGVETHVFGTSRLAERPLEGLLNELRRGGVECEDKLPLTVRGKLNVNEFFIDRPVSSQYVTGLLLALPLLGGGRVVTKGFSSSKTYVDITIEVLRAFGVTVTEEDGVYTVRGAYVAPEQYDLEGDWSSAGFFLVAGAQGDVTVRGLHSNSAQGDKKILDALRLSGAIVEEQENAVRVRAGEKKPFSFSVLTCPDAAPILSVLAATCPGKSVLTDTGVLKYKESDRAAEIVRLLAAFGAQAVDLGDRIEIYGGKLSGGEYVAPDDHRMAMSSAIAAAYADGVSYVGNEDCVNKSYPSFWADYRKTGGKADVSLP